MVLLPGEKVCLELTKVKCGWIEAVLPAGLSGVALLRHDALGTRIDRIY